jgi:hypothetical protein
MPRDASLPQRTRCGTTGYEDGILQRVSAEPRQHDRRRHGGSSAGGQDFASYEETRYLLRSPKNAERLLDAVTDLEAGKGIDRTLIE